MIKFLKEKTNFVSSCDSVLIPVSIVSNVVDVLHQCFSYPQSITQEDVDVLAEFIFNIKNVVKHGTSN